jgi:glycerol-3-phosphate O-acyltransferase
MVERRLKLGLAGTAVEAFARNRVRGIARPLFFVPTTINYALVMEAESLIEDWLKEAGRARYIIEDDEFASLPRLYDFSKYILSRTGALHIRFGAPLDPLGNAVDEIGESLDPHGRRIDPARYFEELAGGGLGHDGQRDEVYTTGLGEELCGHYARLLVLHPTHVVCRVMIDRLFEKSGHRDTYRLLRLTHDQGVPRATLLADVARWRAWLAETPGVGALAPYTAALTDEAFVDDALECITAYHKRPAVVREGDQLVSQHMPLTFFYRNRTAHLPGPKHHAAADA